MSKDRVAMRFRAILIWEPTKPDVVGAEPRKVDPAVVDALFASAIKEDLPKIIGDYRFGELVAVHDAQPTIAKVESRMADQLRARSAQTNAGVTVDKFVVRRLDLNESTQRQGMDDLQRQRLQEIWRGNTNTPLR
jgi:regulator of protease activity HflC (stomatin/prohibitin superfamily)